MHLDWTIPIGTVLLLMVQFIAGIIGMLRAFNAIERSIERRFNEFELQMNTFKEGDIRDLQGRVSRLEAGADEWTKTLRERTHDHANKINKLSLQVDRLERPDRYHYVRHEPESDAS